MSFEPSDSKQSFLPTSIILPDVSDDQQHNLILTEHLKKVNAAVNDKDIAQYVEQEILNGQKFFTPNESGKFRDAFRKVINFGALPDTTSNSIPHGITVDANTVFTRVYAVASDTVNFTYIPIPYASPTDANNIELSVDSTSITITTGNDRSAYTTTYVILEYVKN
ncbi:MAG: hypothetical protein K940chlam3_00135 [Chlamydiae bacterium]|nr:hypothetical protein [Chlamydiota bacterium]